MKKKSCKNYLICLLQIADFIYFSKCFVLPCLEKTRKVCTTKYPQKYFFLNHLHMDKFYVVERFALNSFQIQKFSPFTDKTQYIYFWDFKELGNFKTYSWKYFTKRPKITNLINRFTWTNFFNFTLLLHNSSYISTNIKVKGKDYWSCFFFLIS